MLALFRKYQKGLFIVVSIVVLASFSFFGVQKAGFENEIVEKDGDVGMAIDGSMLRLKDINRMKRFIQSDAHDTQMLMAGEMPNMLNDGVIRTDFIESGLARHLLLSYKDEVENGLKTQLVKQKRFRPYAHKEAPFISVRGLWKQIAPDIDEAFEAFKSIPLDAYEKNVDALLDLYQKEERLPPHMLKQFLHYQLGQMKWVQPDQELMQGTFALFRAKHVGDWFGKEAIDLFAETILNGALVATQKGYVVSTKEAKEALYSNARNALKKQEQKNPTDGHVSQCMMRQLHALQMTEPDAISLWQKVLLFRKYVEDVGSAVFVDAMTAKNYENFAAKKVEKNVYHFAKPIRLKTFRDMLGLQCYIDAVTAPQARMSMHALDLPQAFLPAEHIEKKVPELTYQPCTVAYKSVSKKDVLVEIPVQDVWAKELDETFFQSVKKEIPALSQGGSTSLHEREKAIERLNDKEREKLDFLAREALLEQVPGLLEETLAQAEEREETLHISLGNLEAPLPGITDAAALRELFASGKETIENWTQDGEHFYSFAIKTHNEPIQLVSYEEAKSKGIIDALTTRALEQYYAKHRGSHKELFQSEDGEWKPLRLVMDEVGLLAFSGLCKAIETHVGKTLELSEYPKHRFDHYFSKLGVKLREATADTAEFFAEGPWQITKEEVASIRSEKGDWYDSEAFELSPQSWSSPKHTQDGKPFIYSVSDVGVDEEKCAELIEKERALLGNEVKQELFQQLIAEFKEKDAIHLPLDDA